MMSRKPNKGERASEKAAASKQLLNGAVHYARGGVSVKRERRG